MLPHLSGAPALPDVLTAVGICVLKEAQWGAMMAKAAGKAISSATAVTKEVSTQKDCCEPLVEGMQGSSNLDRICNTERSLAETVSCK